jgi:hypothetical protein
MTEMASTSERYDSCSYEESLRRAVGPGMYQLGTPANDCASCAQDVPTDPYLRYQKWGPGSCAPGQAVDDGSELRGLSYKISKCSADSYLPGKYSSKAACQPSGIKAQCAAPTEDTRLSNPPCTLRGTGWNRWEWLCYNPQDRAMIPFEWNVSYRTVVKDNHVPILPTPMDQSALMPPPSVATPMKPWQVNNSCGPKEMPYRPGNPFALTMDTCKNIQQL